jgi:hypothetical protein
MVPAMSVFGGVTAKMIGKAGVMTANQLTFAASRLAVFLSTGLILASSSAAIAQDCNAEVGVLMKKRMESMEQLNGIAKANKGKLDPVAGCVKLKALVVADREILAYFTKNKEWCAIPEDASRSLEADVEKTTGVANQACTIAAQMKKAQEQQAAGGGLGEKAQKLPNGPL